MDAAKNAWVERVLGLRIEARGDGGSDRGRRLAPQPLKLASAPKPVPIRYVSVEGRALWEDARAAVVQQFGQLQGQLAQTQDADMQAIANLGMGAVQQRLGVAMLAAMMDVDAASPDKAAAARDKARQTVAAFRQQVAGDALFRLLDENPLGAPLSIRATLDGALSRIQQALDTVGAA